MGDVKSLADSGGLSVDLRAIIRRIKNKTNLKTRIIIQNEEV
jgi:hypothetical protein